MVLGKKVAIFYLEWGRNSAPRNGQKRPSPGIGVGGSWLEFLNSRLLFSVDSVINY